MDKKTFKRGDRVRVAKGGGYSGFGAEESGPGDTGTLLDSRPPYKVWMDEPALNDNDGYALFYDYELELIESAAPKPYTEDARPANGTLMVVTEEGVRATCTNEPIPVGTRATMRFQDGTNVPQVRIHADVDNGEATYYRISSFAPAPEGMVGAGEGKAVSEPEPLAEWERELLAQTPPNIGGSEVIVIKVSDLPELDEHGGVLTHWYDLKATGVAWDMQLALTYLAKARWHGSEDAQEAEAKARRLDEIARELYAEAFECDAVGSESTYNGARTSIQAAARRIYELEQAK